MRQRTFRERRAISTSRDVSYFPTKRDGKEERVGKRREGLLRRAFMERGRKLSETPRVYRELPARFPFLMNIPRVECCGRALSRVEDPVDETGRF